MSKPTKYSDVRDYVDWLTKHKIQPTNDYDTLGAFNAGIQPDPVTGHLDDTYKLPNHITYSSDSLYAQHPDAPEPGRWVQGPSGKWNFYASPTNIQNAGGEQQLADYFRKYEKDSRLIFPNGK